MANTPDWFSRYDAQNESLLTQGLILEDFTYISPKSIKKYIKPDTPPTQVPLLTRNVIVLTQSCEFQKASLKHVHIAPVLTFSELVELSQGQFTDDFTEEDLFNQLRSNQRHSRFLLNKCGFSSFRKFYGEFLVVCFDLAVVVSPQYINDYMTERAKRYYLCVNPPYRESLAQSYGRYFMRVGNPIDYDKYPNSSSDT